ncbi:MAG: NVEALA domain-containing protein [Bacteroidales bacterium]
MKTKKVLFAAAFTAVTLLSGYNYIQNNREVKLSDLALANVEALASGEGTGNTGPAEIVDCGGLGTGSKKECMCYNAYDCTPTSCK